MKEYKKLLTNAIEKYQDSEPQRGYFLSGGYDSSINVALASRGTSGPLSTFGIASSKHNTDGEHYQTGKKK